MINETRVVLVERLEALHAIIQTYQPLQDVEKQEEPVRRESDNVLGSQ